MSRLCIETCVNAADNCTSTNLDITYSCISRPQREKCNFRRSCSIAAETRLTMVSMIISPVKMLARTDMPFFHSFNHDHENFFEALFDGIC